MAFFIASSRWLAGKARVTPIFTGGSGFFCGSDFPLQPVSKARNKDRARAFKVKEFRNWITPFSMLAALAFQYGLSLPFYGKNSFDRLLSKRGGNLMTERQQLELYLHQARARLELLQRTNAHGRHGREIHQIEAKMAKARQSLKQSG